ncbi:MAG: histidinol-phosphate transaminase [Woeseiaceae bacterium]|nr:histidinol-phosphate transaminase [Woeseiaceae bacterium]
MSIVKLARPEIQALTPYDAAAQVNNTVRLNANESPLSSSIGNFRRPLNRYPEVRPQRLQAALASRFGCRANQLLVTRGSSEAIDLLIRAFCIAGVDNVLTSSPSFEMYRHFAMIQNAENIQVPTLAENDFAVDVDALISACTSNTKVIFVCSPNNPTGASLPRTKLLRLLDARQNLSAVVVDEAYIEYGTEDSAVDLLDQYPNLMILRTLSKALGFAGARCGAVVGSADAIEMLNAVQAPYALATPVVECIEDVMQSAQLALAEQAIAGVIAERERLIAVIRDFPFVKKVWPSEANFFLIRVDDAELVMQRTAEQKVLLRDFGCSLPGCIRISVGSHQDSKRLLGALETLVEDRL